MSTKQKLIAQMSIEQKSHAQMSTKQLRLDFSSLFNESYVQFTVDQLEIVQCSNVFGQVDFVQKYHVQ